VALPWESIDSQEGQVPTNWEAESGGQWHLETPPGDWQMEPLPEQPGPRGDEVEGESPATPFDSGGFAFRLPEVEDEEAYPPRAAAETGGWTIAILCMGLGIIAACLVIPQADANRRLAYEREKLRLDLTQVQKQIAVNKAFLWEMESDPQLTERLAQREMRAVQQGEAVVDTAGSGSAPSASADAERMSPFSIINVPPPAALAPYQPVGGYFARLCRSPQSHVYLLGAGMILVAGGLVLGGAQGLREPSVQHERTTGEKTEAQSPENSEVAEKD
jgi:hypothetical protein